MRKYFGTDGIRGIVNNDLDCSVAFKIGNALSCIKKSATVVIGQDSRRSGDMLKASLSSGLMAGGADVYNLGLMPTAGVAYLTKSSNADFGIVISASHNPKEYNGIKIFDCDGYKLPDKAEAEIEAHMGIENFVSPDNTGRLFESDRKSTYEQSLKSSIDVSLAGMKIVMDLANGAAAEIAPRVFENAGADVIAISGDSESGNINENCGALHPEHMRKAVLASGADMGVAFDGDSDRLIVCDEKGNIINGDIILYVIAGYYKENGILNRNIVVGTLHTNMGIENAMREKGMHFLRSDIGDRYVIAKMKESGSILGGEQSGHIILGNKSTTGDGVLTALVLCGIMKDYAKPLSSLVNVKQYPQENLNIIVPDKTAVMNDAELWEHIGKAEKRMGSSGRIIVRASGTEPKIRITTECADAGFAKQLAEELAEFVSKIANIV